MYSKSFKNVPLGNEELKKDQGGGKIVFTDANGNEVVQDYQEPNLMVFTNIVPNMIEFEDGTNTILNLSSALEAAIEASTVKFNVETTVKLSGVDVPV